MRGYASRDEGTLARALYRLSPDMMMERISGAAVAELTSDLVRIPSYSGMERQEERVAEYIYHYFEERGIEVFMQEVAPGRPNVIARLPGKGGGSSLMLCGHTDTVPPYDMDNPFSGEIADGLRVFGRGSCDMKGPLAAMMCAMSAVAQSGISHNGDIYFAALADEEESAMGAEYLVKHGPQTDAAIIGEPTNMNICLGQKGLEWIRIRVHGKKVHGGDRENGINAVTMAAHLVHHLESEYAAELAKRTHPILGYATINTGTMRGGDQPSTIPDFCEITLDRRYVPGETRDQVYIELEELLCDMKKRYPGFNAEIEPYFDSIQMLPQSPFCTDESHPLVRCAKETAAQLNLPQGAVTAFPAWTDAGTIHEFSGSTCIIMGPGELSVAHSRNESITISSLEEAANLYAHIMLNFS